MYSSIIKKLDEIKSLIVNNSEKYDFKLIDELVLNLENNIKQCTKIDEKLLNFFNDKKYHRTINDLKKFSSDKLKYKVRKTRRVDIEEELARVATSRNLNIENLTNSLDKSTLKVQAKRKSPKAKPAARQKKLKIEDQTPRWISLNLNQLKEELNDLKRYPDVNSLKQAAISILKPNEKRMRKREKIFNIIVNRIAEDKAITHHGR